MKKYSLIISAESEDLMARYPTRNIYEFAYYLRYKLQSFDEIPEQITITYTIPYPMSVSDSANITSFESDNNLLSDIVNNPKFINKFSMAVRDMALRVKNGLNEFIEISYGSKIYIDDVEPNSKYFILDMHINGVTNRGTIWIFIQKYLVDENKKFEKCNLKTTS